MSIQEDIEILQQQSKSFDDPILRASEIEENLLRQLQELHGIIGDGSTYSALAELFTYAQDDAVALKTRVQQIRRRIDELIKGLKGL